MARYVVDAQTLLYLVDHDLHAHPSHQLVAPNWVRSEALQILLQDVRNGSRSERDALRTHERLTEVKIRLLGDRVSRANAWHIAREYDWDTLQEAEYLAITRLQADAFLTIDPALAEKAKGVVAVGPLEALFNPD